MLRKFLTKESKKGRKNNKKSHKNSMLIREDRNLMIYIKTKLIKHKMKTIEALIIK